MPFALTVLKKYHKKFINNNKSIDCNFMTVGFDTKAEKYNLIKTELILMISLLDHKFWKRILITNTTHY